MRSLLIALTRHPVSMLGTAIASAGAIVFLSLLGIDLVGSWSGPYLGILAYLIVPAIFGFGLLLVPVGAILHRRRVRRAALAGRPEPAFPVIDLNVPRARSIVLGILALTGVNLAILATATYKGVEVMESTRFCGTTCHTVMQPEHVTHARSPHAQVPCVSCHVGPGGSWFVRSKLSGTWQVLAVTFNLYPRPIPSPIHAMRPARETCGGCHMSTGFSGEQLRIKSRHADDESNTPQKTVLSMHLGGTRGTAASGIHWHAASGVRIRYRTDEARATVGDVELTLPDGRVKTFRAKETSGPGAAAPATTTWRSMDCLDCHNRPAHIGRSPAEEVDAALEDGRIDRSLPFVRREGVLALQQSYGSHQEARAGIAAALQAFYGREHPEVASGRKEAIAKAGRALGEIYSQNVFPAMKVTWGTYPTHLGHMDAPGCFRCHDDGHAAPDGEVISQDCNTCHAVLAMDESDAAVLKTLGL